MFVEQPFQQSSPCCKPQRPSNSGEPPGDGRRTEVVVGQSLSSRNSPPACRRGFFLGSSTARQSLRWLQATLARRSRSGWGLAGRPGWKAVGNLRERPPIPAESDRPFRRIPATVPGLTLGDEICISGGRIDQVIDMSLLRCECSSRQVGAPDRAALLRSFLLFSYPV